MKYYTDEKNVQMLIYLMKAHDIKRIVVSPGTTNVTFVGSIQQDPFFEIYSSVDERSAAYIACGLAAETGEPVAISCTGATASRNYFPALTEAYYRNLPILAITSTQHLGRVGQNIAQVIDRSTQPKDAVKMSVNIPAINSEEDEWACNIDINKALLELRRNGGGPVHINLATTYSRNFSVKELPDFRVIKRYGYESDLPQVPNGKVAIFVGNHQPWNNELTLMVDSFCEKYNAAVFYDHCSKYSGKYGVFIGAIPSKTAFDASCTQVDLLIHIGAISGCSSKLSPKVVWRVHPDGKIRDTYKKLSSVFEMSENCFFNKYISDDRLEGKKNIQFYKNWQQILKSDEKNSLELPFSSCWIARQTINLLPENSVLHLAILTSLLTWDNFKCDKNISIYSNTGGFGIDGILSTVIGASLANPKKLYFCVLGDLAFFYDINALGNRHIGKNLRIMLVNNGLGHTMKTHNTLGYIFGDDADQFISASGHFGNKSPKLVRHYAEDLGFKYMSASSKEEYMEQLNEFVDPELSSQAIIFEIFTDSKLENEAQEMIRKAGNSSMMNIAESAVKKLVGENGFQTVKKIIKRKGGIS